MARPRLSCFLFFLFSLSLLFSSSLCADTEVEAAAASIASAGAGASSYASLDLWDPVRVTNKIDKFERTGFNLNLPYQTYMLTATNSLDTTPKCQVCQWIVDQLRAAAQPTYPSPPSSFLYEAEPCNSPNLEPGLRSWCEDVFKKLFLCSHFMTGWNDYWNKPIALCEMCEYDQFPLPSVSMCDNALYMPLQQEPDDRCHQCKDVVRHVSQGDDPCTNLGRDQCRAIQNSLATCYSYERYINQPYIVPRRICEECGLPMDDGVLEAPGIQTRMYCTKQIQSPLLDASSCSTCVNMIHNLRMFPMDNPCHRMDDQMCAFVAENLAQCDWFNRMFDFRQYSALSICEKCTTTVTTTHTGMAVPSQKPQPFCPLFRAGGSNAMWERPRQPAPARGAPSPWLKPEPPAPFPTPWWQRLRSDIPYSRLAAALVSHGGEPRLLNAAGLPSSGIERKAELLAGSTVNA